MEFTELADYPLPAGVVTEWVPRPTSDGDVWVDDERPLTHLHQEYCQRGVGADPHAAGSWLGAIFEVPHRYDADAVRRALATWMRRHEVFRTTVVPTDDAAGPAGDARAADRPFAEDGALRRRSLCCDIDVEPRSVGTLRTGTRVHEHLVDLFESLSPLRWPHCVVATITEPAAEHEPSSPVASDPPGRFLLLFGADHSVMDAHSMLLSIGELQHLYSSALRNVDAGLPATGSHVDFSVSDRALGQSISAEHDAVDAWRTFLVGDTFPGFPLAVDDSGVRESGAPDRRRSQSAMSSWVLSADGAEAINSRARARGRTMQTVVLTALGLATLSVADSPVTRFAMPMHTRNEDAYAHSVGWFVGMIPVEIDMSGAQTLDDCLAAADAAVTRHRHLAPIPYPRVAELMGSAAAPRFVVSYVDTRRIPAAGEWTSWGARTLRGSSDSTDEVYLWIVRSPKGISVSARFPSNPGATSAVHRYLHAMNRVMSELNEATEDPADRRVSDLVATQVAV